MFEPGKSGNPKGRPKKGTALTDVLREAVNAEELAAKLIEMVNSNDIGAIKYVYDRIDGKPRESVDMNQTGEMTYKIKPPPVMEEAYPEDDD